ncbi:MAG: cyclodeaminase/cyclohydrolase family protein [Chloroflexota bacterium]|nr:cyclodeaminase/cyclohydrolase family protein [Chloroflexota bacterium]
MGDPTRLSDLPLRDLADRLASHDPVPGGGSAAAIAGALGAALVSMVVELTVGRPEYSEHGAALREIGAGAVERQAVLLELAEADATAYGSVVTARRMPKQTDPERESRSAALRDAMVQAAAVPLRTAIVASEVLELAERVAPIGNGNAVSDAGVAAQLAAAAVRGALLNVRINLPYLPEDEPLRITAVAEMRRLETSTTAREQATVSAVDARMGPT